MKNIQLSSQGPNLSQIIYGVWRLGDNPTVGAILFMIRGLLMSMSNSNMKVEYSD